MLRRYCTGRYIRIFYTEVWLQSSLRRLLRSSSQRGSSRVCTSSKLVLPATRPAIMNLDRLLNPDMLSSGLGSNRDVPPDEPIPPFLLKPVVATLDSDDSGELIGSEDDDQITVPAPAPAQPPKPSLPVALVAAQPLQRHQPIIPSFPLHVHPSLLMAPIASIRRHRRSPPFARESPWERLAPGLETIEPGVPFLALCGHYQNPQLAILTSGETVTQLECKQCYLMPSPFSGKTGQYIMYWIPAPGIANHYTFAEYQASLNGREASSYWPFIDLRNNVSFGPGPWSQPAPDYYSSLMWLFSDLTFQPPLSFCDVLWNLDVEERKLPDSFTAAFGA